MNWRCVFGSHRYSAWKWDHTKALVQHRTCLDCGKTQTCGSSEECHNWESRRDR